MTFRRQLLIFAVVCNVFGIAMVGLVVRAIVMNPAAPTNRFALLLGIAALVAAPVYRWEAHRRPVDEPPG